MSFVLWSCSLQLGENATHSLKHLFDNAYCGLGQRPHLKPRATLRDAIGAMNTNRVGAMLVRETEEVVGLLSQVGWCMFGVFLIHREGGETAEDSEEAAELIVRSETLFRSLK